VGIFAKLGRRIIVGRRIIAGNVPNAPAAANSTSAPGLGNGGGPYRELDAET